MQNYVVAKEHRLHKIKDINCLLIILEEKEDEVNYLYNIKYIISKSHQQAEESEQLEVSHVEWNLPDKEDTHPCLDIGIYSVCYEVDVAARPQEIPFGIEKYVPCEENL